jgi:hypothetical protein
MAELSVMSRIDTYTGELSQSNQPKPKRSSAWYSSFFQCLARNHGKGFLIGASGWGIVSASRALLGVLRGSKRPVLPQIFNQYTTEWGLLFGSILALFNGTMYLTAPARSVHLEGLDRNRPPTAIDTLKRLMYHYRGVLAGGMCGFGMLFGPQDRETKKTLALFMFMRAAEVMVKVWVEKDWLPSFENADVALMSVASAQVLWAWIYEPSANDPFYQSFLVRHGQKPQEVLTFLRAVNLGLPMDCASLNAMRGAKVCTLLYCMHTD